MKRAVITGIGIVSSIGNNKSEVCESLKSGNSGIEFEPTFAENNLRSHVCGTVALDPKEHIEEAATSRLSMDGKRILNPLGEFL